MNLCLYVNISYGWRHIRLYKLWVLTHSIQVTIESLQFEYASLDGGDNRVVYKYVLQYYHFVNSLIMHPLIWLVRLIDLLQVSGAGVASAPHHICTGRASDGDACSITITSSCSSCIGNRYGSYLLKASPSSRRKYFIGICIINIVYRTSNILHPNERARDLTDTHTHTHTF